MTNQQRLVLLVAILASFVTFLDGSVVNVALPAISRELGGGLSTQQWVVDAYAITLGALMLIAGSISDLFGRKKVLQYGLIGFLAASVLCAVAPTGAVLIIARGLQGVAGALLVPSSLALIMSSFTGRAQGKAIGTWTAWTGIAFIMGPLLGGFLVDAGSWRWIFAINALPVAVTLWLLAKVQQAEQLKQNTELDITGAVLCALALGAIGYGLIEQSQYGWASPLIYGSLALGAAAAAGFVAYEARASHPMLPLGLFKIRNFWVGNLATVAIYSGLSISTFLLVITLQQVSGYSAISAGLALLPVTIIMFFLSPRIGGLSAKFGPRAFMALGPLVAAAGFALMLRLGQPLHYWTQLFPAVVVFGLGLATTVSPLTSAVLGSIEARQAGIASAVNNAISRIAGLVAIASIGLIIGPDVTLTAFHKGALSMVVLLIIGGLVSLAGIRNSPN
ncbi:MAG: mmr [Candidatus Saccharibacteria bacterium]|nr:mmr [Candidatus Saccharibacteria bacterium]